MRVTPSAKNTTRFPATPKNMHARFDKFNSSNEGTHEVTLALCFYIAYLVHVCNSNFPACDSAEYSIVREV